MNRLASFAFSLSLVALAIAACGDHVTVPPDKTGKCTAGLLTKCGDACVDTQTDIANCGGCMMACGGAKVCVQGKCSDSCPPGSTKCGDTCVSTDVDRANCGMCGKACAPNEVCAKGKCGPTCEAAGYTTCSGMTGADAGGAMNCVNASADPNNCGGCGIKCQAAETCTNGTCCAAGLLGCGGACVDPNLDHDNCGGCGVKCTMPTSHCVLGACSACNNDVLVLSDNQTPANVTFKKALQNAGFNTTMVDSGASMYTGMPAATDFGAVALVGLGAYNTDMPMSGQQALLTAQAMGTGMIFDAYVAYNVSFMGHLQGIKTINLYASANGGIGNTGTIAVVGNQFPFFAGVPTSFGTSNASAWFASTGATNGGVQFAQYTYPGPTTIAGGFSRGMPNGRIVQFSFGANWNPAWLNETNQVAWYINGVRWAAGCTN